VSPEQSRRPMLETAQHPERTRIVVTLSNGDCSPEFRARPTDGSDTTQSSIPCGEQCEVHARPEVALDSILVKRDCLPAGGDASLEHLFFLGSRFCRFSKEKHRTRQSPLHFVASRFAARSGQHHYRFANEAGRRALSIQFVGASYDGE